MRLVIIAESLVIFYIMIKKICIPFLIIAILVTIQNCEKPRISAKLNFASPKADSLVVLVNLENHSNKPLFLVCKANQIEIETDNSILANYHGTPEEAFERLRHKSLQFYRSEQ